MKRWHKSFAVLAVCLLSFGSIGYLGIQHSGKAAHANGTGTLIDLGTQLNPIGISDDGSVLATYTNQSYTARYPVIVNSSTGQYSYLSTPAGSVAFSALSINSSTNEVTGTGRYYTNGNYVDRGVIWSSNGTATDLGGPTSGSCDQATGSTIATAVNDLGDVVGYCSDANHFVAGYWPGGAPNSFTKLPDIGTSNTPVSEAAGINHNGTIVGHTIFDNPNASGGISHDATVWLNGTVEDINPSDSLESEANAINDSGLVVGEIMQTNPGPFEPYVWDLTNNTTYNLYTLSGQAGATAATAVSNSGIVVGYDINSGGFGDHPFMWKVGGSYTDLNSLIDPTSLWALISAVGVNSSGQIVGWGTLNGVVHTYVLDTSTPSPYRLSLAPASQTATIGGGQGLVTATLLDSASSAPASNVKLSFRVESGPNAGISGTCLPSSCTTDANGQVDWGYLGTAIGGDTVQVWMDTNSNGVPDTGEPQTTVTVTWILPSTQTYVALGDSYSSGEGNPPFSANQNCDRSYNGWPYLLAKSDTSIKLSAELACSGAKASNALTKSYNPCSSTPCPQLPQIAAMKALQPVLVTITIGGNDLGFTSTLRGCYFEGIAHRQNLCVDRLYSQVAVINGFEKIAVGYYKEIKAALPSTSKVYVVGYPNLFPTQQIAAINCGWLSDAGRAEFNNLAILLDKVLHNAANAAGVNYISTLYALQGHELCTANSWVNPIASRQTAVKSDGHPTLAGQQAIETIVDAAIHQ